MPIYWSILGVTAFLGVVSYYFPRPQSKLNTDNQQTTRLFFALLIFGYIIVICGLRGGIADTPVYVNHFNSLSSSFFDAFANIDTAEKGWGFWFLSGVFKSLISTDAQVWLFAIAAVSGLCVMRTLYKYSVDFPLTAFIFSATSTYMWMINGIRQFLVVAILFAFADWLFEKRTVRYIVLIVILSAIHNSVLVLIPVYFVVKFRPPWNKKILFFIVVILGCVFFADQFTDFFADATGYGDNMRETGGSSLVRVVISAVPCVLAFWKRRQIVQLDSPIMDICINMSVVTTCFYLLSSFTSGIYIGRIPIYFAMYSMLLLPWLLQKTFEKKERALLYALCIVCYVIYFIVDTSGYVYQSDVLHIPLC